MNHRLITRGAAIGVATTALLCPAALAQHPLSGSGAAATPNAIAGSTETGLGPVFSDEGPGANFIGNGRSTRAGVVTCPVNVPLGGLPAGATPTATIIVWHYLTNDAPGTDTIIVNGTAVTGTQVGAGSPDLCWGKELGVAYAFGDFGLLPYVNPGGANVVNDVCDKPLGADPAALGEGVSIIITYRTAAGADARVNLYWGYISTESGASALIAEETLSLGDVYPGGPFRMLVNGMDGQSFDDRFFVNGTDVSGANGLGGPDNAWAGFLGPDPDNNLYDHALDNFAGAITPGATDVTITTTRSDVGDCIGHSVVALRFITDDCPWDLNDDGVVNPADLAILLANWNAPFGPPELAALLAAWGDCPAGPVCGPGAGPCGQPNGTPGCEDVDCCETVCAVDPFCCDNQWDQICANEAIELCTPPATGACCVGGQCQEVTAEACANAGGEYFGDGSVCSPDLCAPPAVCGPGAGPCDQPNGTPGCEDVDCCETVCAVDSFCCDTEWDQICADEAIDLCLNCNAGAGPCDQPNGTPGCDNTDCCTAVCAVDPFCCDNQWDQICANEAIDLCKLP